MSLERFVEGTSPHARSVLSSSAKAGEWVLLVDSVIDLTGCTGVKVGGDYYFASNPGVATSRIVIHRQSLSQDYPKGTEVTGCYLVPVEP
jgi:hypothetical protein